jgi:hypothetical protein
MLVLLLESEMYDSRLLFGSDVGCSDRTSVTGHHHRVEFPFVIGQSDRDAGAADLESGQELIEGNLGGISGRKEEIELVKVWLCKVFRVGSNEFIGSELDTVVLFVGRVGEDNDLGSECLCEHDGKVCGSAFGTLVMADGLTT